MFESGCMRSCARKGRNMESSCSDAASANATKLLVHARDTPRLCQCSAGCCRILPLQPKSWASIWCMQVHRPSAVPCAAQNAGEIHLTVHLVRSECSRRYKALRCVLRPLRMPGVARPHRAISHSIPRDPVALGTGVIRVRTSKNVGAVTTAGTAARNSGIIVVPCPMRLQPKSAALIWLVQVEEPHPMVPRLRQGPRQVHAQEDLMRSKKSLSRKATLTPRLQRVAQSQHVGEVHLLRCHCLGSGSLHLLRCHCLGSGSLPLLQRRQAGKGNGSLHTSLRRQAGNMRKEPRVPTKGIGP